MAAKENIKQILFLLFIIGVRGQDGDLALDGYEEVTEKSNGDIGALESCGEGSTASTHKCVPYYQCDGKTNTIVESGNTDGHGLIDIRIGVNSCQHFLDVCCRIPTGPTPIRPPTPTPTSPTTEEPITPTKPSVPATFCGIRNPNGIDFKIKGNNDNEAEYGEFPWMVAILKTNYDPQRDSSIAICGGSLITPIVVLTGAHCVNQYSPKDLKVRGGEWDTQTTKERYPYQERNVLQIKVHESYNTQTLFNDFALLILEKVFSRAKNIGTICLPPQGPPIQSKDCYATGWGKDVFGKKGKYQVILKKIKLPIVDKEKCQQDLRSTRLGKLFELHPSFTCAGGEFGRDTCTGDGGSPLVCPDPNNPSRYVQAGIVAWGIGCGEDNVPGVYADVTKVRNWIDQELTRLNIPTEFYVK